MHSKKLFKINTDLESTQTMRSLAGAIPKSIPTRKPNLIVKNELSSQRKLATPKTTNKCYRKNLRIHIAFDETSTHLEKDSAQSVRMWRKRRWLNTCMSLKINQRTQVRPDFECYEWFYAAANLLGTKTVLPTWGSVTKIRGGCRQQIYRVNFQMINLI